MLLRWVTCFSSINFAFHFAWEKRSVVKAQYLQIIKSFWLLKLMQAENQFQPSSLDWKESVWRKDCNQTFLHTDCVYRYVLSYFRVQLMQPVNLAFEVIDHLNSPENLFSKSNWSWQLSQDNIEVCRYTCFLQCNQLTTFFFTATISDRSLKKNSQKIESLLSWKREWDRRPWPDGIFVSPLDRTISHSTSIWKSDTLPYPYLYRDIPG